LAPQSKARLKLLAFGREPKCGGGCPDKCTRLCAQRGLHAWWIVDALWTVDAWSRGLGSSRGTDCACAVHVGLHLPAPPPHPTDAHQQGLYQPIDRLPANPVGRYTHALPSTVRPAAPSCHPTTYHPTVPRLTDFTPTLPRLHLDLTPT
jgi:hypothetical protein